MQIIVHYELESEPSVVHVEHYLCSAQRVVKAISCDHPSERLFHSLLLLFSMFASNFPTFVYEVEILKYLVCHSS